MSGLSESETGFHSRRGFLRWASSLTAAIGATPLLSSAKALSTPTVTLKKPTNSARSSWVWNRENGDRIKGCDGACVHAVGSLAGAGG